MQCDVRMSIVLIFKLIIMKMENVLSIASVLRCIICRDFVCMCLGRIDGFFDL